MAYPKQVQPAKMDNYRRAIESHAGFVSYVSGKVKKIGIEEVLKNDEYKWLRKSWDRVLTFAEEVQLKQVTQKNELEVTGGISIKLISPKERLDGRIPEAVSV